MLLHTWNSLDPDLTAYRDNILMKQTMERYARSWGHIQPPWYFLTNVIPLLWLPTVVLVPWLWPRWRACFRGESTPVLLLLCWILLVLAFFSATPGKRGVYLLPAVPALALAVAPWARSLSTRTGVRTLALIFVGLVTVACAAFALRPPANLIEQAGASAGTLRGLFAAWSLSGMAILAVCRLRRASIGVIAMVATLMIGYGAVVFPVANALRSGSNIPRAAEALLERDETLGLVRWKEQFLLHASRPLVHFGYRRNVEAEEMADALAWLGRNPDRALVLRETDIEPCFNPERAQHLGYAHRHDWYLLRAAALTGSCDTPAAPVYRVEYSPAGRYRLPRAD